MEKQIQQLLVAELKRQVPPKLNFVELDTARGTDSDCLYIDCATKPTFFLAYQASDNRNAFTVEMAWSCDGAFPQPAAFPVPRDWEDIGVKRGDVGVSNFRFRLTKLWVKPKFDPWWEFDVRRAKAKSSEMSVYADPEMSITAKCEWLVSSSVDRVANEGFKYMREIRQRFRTLETASAAESL